MGYFSLSLRCSSQFHLDDSSENQKLPDRPAFQPINLRL